jgi:hypothetical protein
MILYGNGRKSPLDIATMDREVGRPALAIEFVAPEALFGFEVYVRREITLGCAGLLPQASTESP